MVNSKQKGKRGELDFVHYLKAKGIEARRGQQYSGTETTEDVVSSLPVHWEVKNYKKLSVYKFIKQAIKDSNSKKTPIVALKANNEEWLALIRMDDLIALYMKDKG